MDLDVALVRSSVVAANYALASWAYGRVRGTDLAQVAFMVPAAMHLGSYWLFSLATALVELTGRPAWLYAGKIQPSRRMSLAKHVQVALYVLGLQVFLALPILYACLPLFPDGAVDSDPPGFLRSLLDLGLCLVVEEVGFFYSHYALHSKLLYRFHKRHHELNAPSGAAAEYASPLEFVVGDVLPVMAGPLLFRLHPVSAYLWTLMAIQTTCISHCGFYHRLMPHGDARRHDYHHSHQSSCFGVMGWLDTLHGTEQAYTKWVAEHDAQLAAASKKSS